MSELVNILILVFMGIVFGFVCGYLGGKGINRTELETENERLRDGYVSLFEIAERVKEGEEWDLAGFVIRKAKGLNVLSV